MKTLDLSRRGITTSIRKALLPADCVYCGFTATEIDHIVPRSRGGGLDPENLAPACFECNREKSDLTPDEWAKHRIATGKPWPIPTFYERVKYFVLNEGMGVQGFDKALADQSFSATQNWVRMKFPSIRAALVSLRDRRL